MKSTDFGVLKPAMRCAREADDIGRRRFLSRLHHHDRFHRFAPLLVGHADHGDFGDVGMVADRALDLGGIDVLAAGDDHVLDAVVDVEIAVLVEIAGVSSAQPVVLVQRSGGGLRQVPVAGHVGAGARRDLADFARRQFVAVGIEDRELNAGQGLAGGAHAVQPLDVILRRQCDDGAGGLGHAVHLHKTAFEHLDAFLQQRRRNRRGAIQHVFQLREIDLAGAGLPHHELHRGRHHEQLGDAGFFEEIQHLCRIEFARDHALGAVIEAEHAPAGAADVKHRHRHQRDIVIGPFVPVRPLGAAGSYQRKKIRMRQHRAFRLSGGARGVELDRDVLVVDRHLRIVAALRVAPGGKIEPVRRAAFGRHEGAHARQLRLDAAHLVDEFRTYEQHRRLAVLDDERDLGSGQPPVHRRHHHIGLHRAEQEFEIDVAVLAEIGDALMRLDAERLEPVGDAVGMNVEARKRGAAAFEFEGGGIAAKLALRAYHVGEVLRVCDVGHVSPVSDLFLRSLARLRGQGNPAFFGRSAVRALAKSMRCSRVQACAIPTVPVSAMQLEERCIAPGTRVTPLQPGPFRSAP